MIVAGEENSRLNAEINSKTEDIVKANNELIKSQGETIKNLMGSGYAMVGNICEERRITFLC